MPVKTKLETTTMVRVDTKIHGKVKTKLKKSRKSIGTFYDEAVQEKLKTKKQ